MNEPLWYKEAVFYELHVRSFQDGNQDGIGDFAGLTQRLDYLSDLGVTVLWLLPFTCSPLKDDGYDISDYTNVHPNYGTLDDFRSFLDKAHAAGMRVVTELVINHTSDQHPWFQRARRAPPGSSERNFYVWSDDPDRYQGVPLMFPDFENSNWAWDPLAKQYYWHRFYSHQPDLNFDNPDVREAILPVVDFWFGLGVDGLRLDAVPYLFEREGTSCEHLPETHGFLKALRKHVDERFPDRMFLAEANAWPDDMVAYFGDGDECQMAFHFPLMPRLYLALHQENRFPITDILAQTPAIPAECQWCLFLRNHDELTLAMVTEQERDAMYSAYTRDRQARLFLGIRHRLAPLLRNDRRRIELMNAILFSLPGTPVLYYGDEIGMGDNIYLGDRNGVRTPMQWSDDRNAGFSRANSQKLFLPVIIDSEYHYEAVNVETQQNNPSSLLWWTKRLISLRKRHPAFGCGSFRVLEPANSRVLAYVRETESECLLIVANLSRFVQNAQLDLSPFAGLAPEELFGRTRFPMIEENEPYGLTLGPHGYYWFSLVPEKVTRATSTELPLLAIRDWADLLRGPGWEALTRLFASRYATSSDLRIENCRLLEFKPISLNGQNVALFICRLEYASGSFETIYQMLALASEERFQGPDALNHAIAWARTGPPLNQVLCDPIGMPEFTNELLASFLSRKPIPLTAGTELVCEAWNGFDESVELADHSEAVTVNTAKDLISSAVLNRQWLLRTFRRPDEGLNPDVEVGRFLQDAEFTGFARIEGTIQFRRHGSESITLAALHRQTPNQSDAWLLMIDLASRFFEVMAAQTISQTVETTSDRVSPVDVSLDDWENLVGPFLNIGKSIASFTARLHMTLANVPGTSSMTPLPIQPRSFYQSLRNAAGQLNARLAVRDSVWPEPVRDLAGRVRNAYPTIMKCIRGALEPDLAGGRRIRCHGRFRLRRLLVSGQDYVLTDFEGVKDRPLSERRIKRSPLYDVATMLTSFNYAISAVRLELIDKSDVKLGFVRAEDHERLKSYASAWVDRLEREFLQIYFTELESMNLLPSSVAGCHELLDLCLLEQAFRDVEHDLAERPAWAVIPLSTIMTIIQKSEPIQLSGVS